jgi:bacterioferritin (cytochrome b1)
MVNVEMHHAEWLMRCIIFLDGAPVISRPNPMKIRKAVLEMVCDDQIAELAGTQIL